MVCERNSSFDVHKVQPKNNSAGHIKHLPYDILLDILSWLPVESVLECKLVCKTRPSLLTRNRRYFNDMHVRRQLKQLYDEEDGASKVDSGLLFARTVDGNVEEVALFYGGVYNDKINTDEQYTFETTLRKIRHPRMRFHGPRVYLVGSCNGLICLGRHHDEVIDPIYVCNPVTGEYTYLPKLNVPPQSPTRIINVAQGFGYVRSTDEYKVVRIFFDGHRVEGKVQVYTLGSGCGWRTKTMRFPWGGYFLPGILANEAIYWAVHSEIKAFDLASEKFLLIPSPPCFTESVIPHGSSNFGLVVLGGSLCFFYQNVKAPQIEIWSWKSNRIWTKDFDIQVNGKDSTYFKPIMLTKNGEVIFSWLESRFYCYNPRTGSWKLLVDDDCVDVTVAVPHVNTFVSLKAIGEN